MKDDVSDRSIAAFWAKVSRKHPDECWEWVAAKNNAGYGVFRGRLAHRFSALLAFGPAADGIHVCHHCDRPSCVNPKHLFYGTRSDNMRDARIKGRMVIPIVRDNAEWEARRVKAMPKGAAVWNAKLTDADVIEIRKLRVSGLSIRKIATQYGLDRSTVSAIVKGEWWRHLFDHPECPPLGDLLAVKVDTKPSAKITAEIVKDIKRRLAKGETGRSIAKLHGIHFATVSDIKLGKIWRDT